MPILLTTPFNPGDNNPGVTYPHVKIMSQYHNTINQFVRIEIQIGTQDELGNWTRGVGTPDRAYEIRGEEYLTIATAAQVEGETVFGGVHRLCYQYLIDKGFVLGTIV